VHEISIKLIPIGTKTLYILIPICIKNLKKYTYKKVSRTGNSDEKVGKNKKIFPNGQFCKKKFWDCKKTRRVQNVNNLTNIPTKRNNIALQQKV